MRCSIALIMAACLVCILYGDALGQGDWEFLGPGVGYQPDAFFVSQHAIYLGLSEEDLSGLGLYRYRFDEGEWQLFAWEGYGILGITVWGGSDENILLIRYERAADHSDVLLSTDGGGTWIVTLERDWEIYGLTQAPSDTARLVIHYPMRYSTDGGWSWNLAHGYPANGIDDVSFDPSNVQVAYLTGQDVFGFESIYKSTNGGATWFWVLTSDLLASGIDVERDQVGRVMAGTVSYYVHITTDAGEDWSIREAPFKTKRPFSPPWSPGSFFVAGSDSAETTFEVWRTEDLGDTWFPCGQGLPDLPQPTVWGTSMYLEGHPTEPVLYAALEGSGVWRWDVSSSAAPDADASSDPGIRLLLYPNPSTDRFQYGLRLSRPERVVLKLFDVRGRFLQTLKNRFFPAGTHIFYWRESDGGDHPVTSGIYYLRLDAGGTQEKRKIVLLR